MSLYNIDTPHIHSYRCINVSECVMPWNICSLGMMWLGKTQAKAGGQPSLEAVPRLLREAAVWDSGWKEPSNQESPGRGGIQMHSFVTEYGIHRRKWLKAWEGMRWGNPEDSMGSGGSLSRPAKHSHSLTTLIHVKNPNTTFTALPLPTQLHMALLWGWTYTEIGWKINSESHPLLKTCTWDKTRSC